jgi:hypothetical protein
MHLLPNYLLIGAQKSGTTFLQAALAEHPAIARHEPGKEVHYFDWHFSRGTAWYRSHFPTRGTREHIRRRHGEFATGERSPNYLFHPDVPERVRGLLPDVKLIVLLRNPVDRALSHYQQERRRGEEELFFEEALACELRLREVLREPPRSEPPRNRRLGPTERPRSYLARGLYAEQLERWLDVFDRDQVHVTLSERLFADPAQEVCAIQRFIGLTPVAPEDLRPRNKGTYEPMPSDLRTRLQGFFAAYVDRLTNVLGGAPGWW